MRLRLALPVLGLCALGLLGCGDLRVIPEEGEADATSVPVTLQNITLTSYSGTSAPEQRVTAARSQLFDEEGYATLEDFTLQFFQDGTLYSEVNADWGRVDMDTSVFVAFARDERIRVRRFDENVVIYVTQCAYNPETRRLSTTLPPGVESPGGTDEHFICVQATPDGSAQIIEGRDGVSADLQLNARFLRPSLRHVPAFDIEAFDREFRPIHREDTP